MQTIEILYNLARPGIDRSIRLSTRLTYLEILRQLGHHSAAEDVWLKIRGRLDGWMTPDTTPTIVVRGHGVKAEPEDTVELWWHGRVLECYRLGEMETMFGVAT